LIHVLCSCSILSSISPLAKFRHTSVGESISIQQLAWTADCDVRIRADAATRRLDHSEESDMTAAQTATPGKTTTWQVDPAHTNIEFAVKHLMISTVRGRFSDVTGTVIVPANDFSRAQIDATVHAEIVARDE
jgi:polyisoprenoid-binding protein YceI